MIDYGTIANTSGSFPSVIGVDASGGGAVDGTPYIADVVNDIWGANQALMDAAGLTPDGVAESSTASQRLLAIQRIAGHPGEIFLWGGTGDPTADGVRAVQCTGQVLSLSGGTYDDLVTATYVGDPNNTAAHTAGGAFVKTSDAGGTTPSTSGTYFVLPDLRGMFVRGEDAGAVNDPAGASRYLGDSQTEMVNQHNHYLNEQVLFAPAFTSAGTTLHWVCQTNPGVGSPIQIYNNHLTSAVDLGSLWAETLVSLAPAPNETRPVNSNFRWSIRY